MISINIFGDFVPRNRGVKAVTDNTAISHDIIDVIKGADYNIVNLECPVVSHNDATPILKDGPNLKCAAETVMYLKDVGFNLCTLANNHLKDYGEVGIQDTLKACNDNGIEWVGAGANIKEARIPKIIELGGMNIGIVNVCENESSIATEDEAGSNPIDEINNYYDICELKKKTDKIIVIIHGGTEHFNLPTPRIKKRCHFYADLGVSAIVCHHTHCYSGYEIYHNVPIFYSLGNFFFDNAKNHSQLWTTGYFVQLNLSKEKVAFNICPYIQCQDNAQVTLLNDKQKIIFEKDIENINSVIRDNRSLKEHYEQWQNKRYKHYIAIALTWGGKYYKAAYRRSLIPAFISKRNAILLLNYIRCESHYDIIKMSLEKYLKKYE